MTSAIDHGDVDRAPPPTYYAAQYPPGPARHRLIEQIAGLDRPEVVYRGQGFRLDVRRQGREVER